MSAYLQNYLIIIIFVALALISMRLLFGHAFHVSKKTKFYEYICAIVLFNLNAFAGICAYRFSTTSADLFSHKFSIGFIIGYFSLLAVLILIINLIRHNKKKNAEVTDEIIPNCKDISSSAEDTK